MKKIVFSLLLAGIVTVGFAEKTDTKAVSTTESSATSVAEFKGTISDKTTGESLAGVEVCIKGTSIKAYTDFDGNFSFKNLKAGEYDLEVSYVSYEKSLVENLQIDPTKNQVQIKLQASK